MKDLDTETYKEDYLTPIEQEALQLIKDQLELLFRITKALEGNVDLKDNACKASYSALQEILLTFEFLLSYFEGLENDAKAKKFQGHPGVRTRHSHVGCT